MSSSRPFKSELVIEEHITLPELRGYHVGFDQKKFRLEPLVDIIRCVIPEYALGYHQGSSVSFSELIERVSEAARTVYTTDKYKNRGEFGELILHLLLRDFHSTIPLISTIYFRDAVNIPPHGFDGVHVSVSPSGKKLWLGESKLYKNGSAGIGDLLKDMKTHLTNDYLRKQFTLVSRKIPANAVDIKHWQDLLHKNQKLDTIFKSLVIPMVCTYNSDLFNNHKDNTPEYFRDFEEECNILMKQFQKGKSITKVEFILMLLPVKCKDSLNKALHQRLVHMQKI